LLLCCILKNLAAAVDPVATELKVELVDGGRLISSQPEDSLTFQTEFGSIKVGWERMRSLRFSSGTNQCQLRLTNGDHLTVRLEAESLALTTLLGKLTVPVRHLARVDVSDPRAFPGGLVLQGKKVTESSMKVGTVTPGNARRSNPRPAPASERASSWTT